MTDKKISELTSITGADVTDAEDVLPIVDTSVATTKKITRAELFQSVSALAVDGNITVGGTVDGRDVASDGTKLDGIEAGADVTDAANVEAAGALMDSEVTNLAAVKAFDPTDYVPQTSTTGSAEIPAGTDAERDGTPSAGYFRFNTDSGNFEGYDGASWGEIGGGSGDLSAVAQDIIPDADSNRDLGSTSKRWAQGWFDSLNGNPIATAGSLSNRNKIINGNFDFWQRGTSGSSGYVADRWLTSLAGSTAAISRQSFTLGQTDVPGEPDYYHRTVVTSSAGASNLAVTQQRIESVKTLAGQTATLSFWAKADASKNMAVEFFQIFGTGGSPSTVVNTIGVTTIALTTSWQKFTVTANIPSISGKTLGTNNDDYLGVVFWFDAGSNFDSRTNTLGQQSGTFDIARVQLEAGDVATPFEERPIGTELELCQRYFTKLGGEVAGDIYYAGYITSAGAIIQTLTLPVKMRAAPTGTVVGTWTVSNVAQPTTPYISTNTSVLSATGTVVGQGLVYTSGTTTYLTYSAEL